MRRWSELADRLAATTRTSEKTALLAEYLRSLTPDELPIAASVWAHRNIGPWREDVAYLRLDFPTTHAFVHVSWLNPNKVRRTTVVGEIGRASCRERVFRVV